MLAKVKDGVFVSLVLEILLRKLLEFTVWLTNVDTLELDEELVVDEVVVDWLELEEVYCASKLFKIESLIGNVKIFQVNP